MVELLNSFKVLVCAGTGGVGKTTLSASLGVLAAKQGLRVLVLTIDPARRLAMALGIQDSADRVQVPLPFETQGDLYAAMIHPQKIFDDFVRKVAPSSELAERLIGNSLYKQLSTNLSGSQEFTSLVKVLEAYESNEYDLIILDTPPAQHAIDFLQAPEEIFNLFQDSVTKWFARPHQGKGLFGQVFDRGTKIALGALEKVTGGKFIGELSGFFESISSFQKEVRECSIQLHQLLNSSKTKFALITGFDEAKLKEAEDFRQSLALRGNSLSFLIMNRDAPDWPFPKPEEKQDPRWSRLKDFYDEMTAFYSSRRQSYDKLMQNFGPEVLRFRIPELEGAPAGLGVLVELAGIIEAQR